MKYILLLALIIQWSSWTSCVDTQSQNGKIDQQDYGPTLRFEDTGPISNELLKPMETGCDTTTLRKLLTISSENELREYSDSLLLTLYDYIAIDNFRACLCIKESNHATRLSVSKFYAAEYSARVLFASHQGYLTSQLDSSITCILEPFLHSVQEYSATSYATTTSNILDRLVEEELYVIPSTLDSVRSMRRRLRVSKNFGY